MGAMKEMQQRLHDLESQVVPYCVEAELLVACPLHEDIVMTDSDYGEQRKHAYALVTNAWKAGKLKGDRKECIAAVDSAAANAYSDCPYCSKIRDDDD